MSIYTEEKGQVWVKSPQIKESISKGVWVYPGEEVEWHYTCTQLGTQVTGYTIIPSPVENNDNGEVL